MKKTSKSRKLFSQLKHSTATVKFQLSNVILDEHTLTNQISNTLGDKTKTKHAQIVKVGSNFGEILMEGYFEPKTPNPGSNRGRKPHKKNKNKRKVQGSGKYFNSQITFFVKMDMLPFNVYMDIQKRKVDYSIYNINKKDKNNDGECRLVSCIYKVKVFRNGNSQIPGLKTEDPLEIKRILKPVRNLFSVLLNKPVKAKDYHRFIQNYKSHILNNNHYEIKKIRQYFEKQPTGPPPKKIFRAKESTHSKLLVYFNTPTDRNQLKTTNLTIYRKGSVNIDGAVSRDSATEILAYFEEIIKKNPSFLFDPDASSDSSEEPSTSEASETSRSSSD